jgi:putative membrane protein
MRRERTGTGRDAKRSAKVRSAAIAFGFLGGIVAWTLHLAVSYALVPFVCGTGREWLLHLLTGAAAGVAAVATGVAWDARRRIGESAGTDVRGGGEPTDEPALRARRVQGFLAFSGILLSGFFLLLIVVEGLPALLARDPCGLTPILDRPIIRSDPETGPLLAMLIHGDGLIGPGQLWRAWNLDPWLLGAIYAVTALYGTGVRRLWRTAGRGRGIRPWRVWAYFGGIAALLLALVSPVDAVGGALFSVHMVQHMLLMVVAAPLLILGRPMLGYLWALPESKRRGLGLWWRRFRPVRWSWSLLSHPVTVLVLHVGALWLWHLPGLYQAALARPGVHHLEHASFFFTAMLFWWALSEAGARGRWPGYGAAILYVFATALQSGALGALLLFAREPWYPAHEAGAAAWGVDLLVDQQLAGALMWIPAGLVYAAAALVLFLTWVKRSDQAVARRERAGWQRLFLEDPRGRFG